MRAVVRYDLAELAGLCRQEWAARERALRESGVPLAMAASPSFAGTVNMGAASLSATADTSYTAPANAVIVATAGASGSKIDELDFQGIGTTIAGTITVFLYDGTNYHLFDCIAVPASTASTTQPPWRYSKQYANLILPNGWSLRVSSTVASQLVNVSAFGGSF